MKKELIPIEQIYVTGHRNPDTDSIVSAMAYAALRNAVATASMWLPGWAT